MVPMLTSDDKKNLILQFIAMNPGVTSVDINVGLSRSSVGSYTKSLSKEGLIIKLSSGGWQMSAGYVACDAPKVKTAMDIAEECIRKMMTTR